MEALLDAPLWIAYSVETVDDTPVPLVGKRLVGQQYDSCVDNSFDDTWKGGKSMSACHLLCAPSTREIYPGICFGPNKTVQIVLPVGLFKVMIHHKSLWQYRI
eukprot:7981370-Ditylum_brightwellii.AAC.1